MLLMQKLDYNVNLPSLWCTINKNMVILKT